MTIHALVEQLDEHSYRATIWQPLHLSAEGRSREEALERLRHAAGQRLAAGQLVRVDLPDMPEPNPWIEAAGAWKDHPDMDEYLENIAEYRRQVDAAEPRP
jgi:predicted RNase H-like HicB family nuclease